MSSSTDSNRRDKSDTSSDDDDDYGSWRNIFSIVRKWKLTFNGDREESVKLFLDAVKQKQWLTDLSDSELLEALPCLLTGTALMWYRLIRKKWSTWEHFCEDARHVFRNSEEYNLELAEKAHARVQGKDERVVDYISDLRHLMELQDPEPALDAQIKLLYSNMLPALQRFVRRDEIEDIQTFYRLAVDAERSIEEQRRYEPPRATEDSSVPELACKPLVQGVRKMKPRLQVGVAIVSEVIDEKLREIENTDTLHVIARAGPYKLNEE